MTRRARACGSPAGASVFMAHQECDEPEGLFLNDPREEFERLDLFARDGCVELAWFSFS